MKKKLTMAALAAGNIIFNMVSGLTAIILSSMMPAAGTALSLVIVGGGIALLEHIRKKCSTGLNMKTIEFIFCTVVPPLVVSSAACSAVGQLTRAGYWEESTGAMTESMIAGICMLHAIIMFLGTMLLCVYRRMLSKEEAKK